MDCRTKKYKHMRDAYCTLSFLCIAGPIVYFLVKAMIQATPKEKVAIGGMACACIILCIVNVLMKVHPRCALWLVLLAAYYAFGNILEVLYVLAIACFLDEIWFTPMKKYAASKYSINKEIDRRG